MDDFEKILRDAEKEGIKVNQGLSRLLLDMWKNSQDEIRDLIAKSKRLCAVAIIASALAAFSFVAFFYLVSVVTEQKEEISSMQGEIDFIWSIFEEGVVIEETTTTETTTTETVTQDTGEGNGNNIYQAGDYSTYTQEVAGD